MDLPEIDLPMEVAGGLQPPPIPLISTDYWNFFVRFPSSSDNGQSAHISMRIPLEMMEGITLLRDWSRSKFPSRDIWPTTSDFARSALVFFMSEMNKIRDLAERGELPDNSSTGLLAAQSFVEQIGGELTARARTMAKAQSQAFLLARAIRDLINRNEPIEAADMISTWVEGTTQMREQTGSAFWERMFLSSLFRIPTMIEDTTALIDAGFIVDEDIITNLQHVLELIEAGDLSLAEDDTPADAPSFDNITTIGEQKDDNSSDIAAASGNP